MSEPIRSIQTNLTPPEDLVAAVKKGVPLERSVKHKADTKATHIRRFSKALIAYVCIAAVIVSSVYFLPMILSEDTPPVTQPSDTSTTPQKDPPLPPVPQTHSPESLYAALLVAEEASVTVIDTDGYTVRYKRDGSIWKQEAYDADGELIDTTYYDADENLMYYRYESDGIWDTYEPDPFGWEFWISSLNRDFFEDDRYEKTDNGYRFSDAAVAAYCEENHFDGDFEVTVTVEGDTYTVSVSLTGDSLQSDWKPTYIITLADQTLKLPSNDPQDIIVDGLAYVENEDGSYTVVGLGECLDTHVVIPSTYNGKPVTAIADEAFYNDQALFGVTIPSSVKTIGARAFSDCQRLSEVNIANGVEFIGTGAFYFCNSLERVTIPGSVKMIGSEAFSCCNYLQSVTIGEGVTKIGNSAFSICHNMTNISLPDSLKEIGNWAFEGCENLTDITLPEGLTSIGTAAFAECYALREITIPGSVKEIEARLFTACSSLTNITIENGVESIGSGALAMCYSIRSITIPESVTQIGEEAFYGCSALTRALFESPDGWSAYGEAVDLSNPSTAATYLTNTYVESEWTR